MAQWQIKNDTDQNLGWTLITDKGEIIHGFKQSTAMRIAEVMNAQPQQPR